jgi:hypothetical protein
MTAIKSLTLHWSHAGCRRLYIVTTQSWAGKLAPSDTENCGQNQVESDLGRLKSFARGDTYKPGKLIHIYAKAVEYSYLNLPAAP